MPRRRIVFVRPEKRDAPVESDEAPEAGAVAGTESVEDEEAPEELRRVKMVCLP